MRGVTKSSIHQNAAAIPERSLCAPCHDKRRVLILLPSLGGGGSERVMITLLKHLDRRLFDLHLGVVNATGPLREQVPEDVTLHDLMTDRVRHSLLAMVRLVWTIRPQTILSTLGHLNLALLALRPLLPPDVRLCVRESTILSASFRTEKQSPIWARLHRWLYPTADTVICQSDVMLNDLYEQFQVPRRKMVRIYNPVDWDRIRDIANHGSNPFVGSGPHLVASGRLEHAKGFDLLIEAMWEVRQHFPQAQLTIVGSGTLEKELRDQCARLGLAATVKFAGFHSDPFSYYLNADLFVLSSRYEGLPNVMLEAMAIGTPLVATDCPGGVREIVKGWPNCRLARAGDSASMADAIVTSLRSGRQTAGATPDSSFNQTALPYALRAYENLLAS